MVALWADWTLTALQKCLPLQAFRSAHKVPTLSNQTVIVEKGIPGLLSKKGFKIAYLDYQQHMVDELNTFTSGMARAQTYRCSYYAY